MSQIWQAYVDASFMSLSVCTCMYVSLSELQNKKTKTHEVMKFTWLSDSDVIISSCISILYRVHFPYTNCC